MRPQPVRAMQQAVQKRGSMAQVQTPAYQRLRPSPAQPSEERLAGLIAVFAIIAAVSNLLLPAITMTGLTGLAIAMMTAALLARAAMHTPPLVASVKEGTR